MEDATRRTGLRRAVRWTGLCALLMVSAGAALHYATSTTPAAGPDEALASERSNPAARTAGVTHAASKSVTSAPSKSRQDSEAPEPEENGDAWLGVVLAGGDEDGDDESEGVRILSVAAGSPAEEAGLKRNDRVVKMGDRTIESYSDISRFMDRHNPGDEVTIVVVRAGSRKNLEATLGEEPRHRRRHVRIFTDEGDGESFHFEMPEPPEPPDAPGAPRAPHPRGVWQIHTGPRPRLGVSVHPMSDDLRAFFKTPRNAGVLVDRVHEGTPAEKAGMKAGDIIVAVDGEEVSGPGDIGEALSEKEAGEVVDVQVLREGSEQTLKVTIEESASRKRRGSYKFALPGTIELPDDLDEQLSRLGELEGLKGDALTPEVQQEIRRSMKLAQEQVREAMERVREELNEERIQIHEQRRESEKEQRKMERQLRDQLRELRDRGAAVTHTRQTVSYDL